MPDQSKSRRKWKRISDKIPTELALKRWKLFMYEHPIFKLTLDEIENLLESTKSQYLKAYEDFFRNENTQSTVQCLVNVRALRLTNLDIDFSVWMMDRLKEALKEYVEGQWLSSIALCGALVEFIAIELYESASEKFQSNYNPKRIRKLIKALYEKSLISEKEHELLTKVRELRADHIHLNMLTQNAEELKNDNLTALNSLLEYLVDGPSWKIVNEKIKLKLPRP